MRCDGKCFECKYEDCIGVPPEEAEKLDRRRAYKWNKTDDERRAYHRDYRAAHRDHINEMQRLKAAERKARGEKAYQAEYYKMRCKDPAFRKYKAKKAREYRQRMLAKDPNFFRKKKWVREHGNEDYPYEEWILTDEQKISKQSKSNSGEKS